MMKVYIWKAPEGAEARYCTIDESGSLIRGWGKLSDIREWYRLTDSSGSVELIRELHKTYQRKGANSDGTQ